MSFRLFKLKPAAFYDIIYNAVIFDFSIIASIIQRNTNFIRYTQMIDKKYIKKLLRKVMGVLTPQTSISLFWYEFARQ